MKLIGITLLLAVTALAQPANNLAAAGMSYQPGAAPAVAGTGLYAKALAGGSGTFAFTVVDALPMTVKPFTVTTQIGVGIAQRVATIGKVDVFLPTSAGISYSGTNTGWAWTTGALASITVGAGRVMPNVRLVKSSVSGGDGYAVIIGVLWGVAW